MAQVHTCIDSYVSAEALYRRVVQLDAKFHPAWNNLGMVIDATARHGEARDAFMRAHKLEPGNAGYIANVAMTYSEEERYDEARKWAGKALKIDPGHVGALGTLGFADLAQGKWQAGWAGFDTALGGKFRRRIDYGLPEWKGERNAKVIVYGEQGLGDEIMYASCVADLAKVVGWDNIALDVDSRLQNLFRRSFPCEAYGTRRDEKHWMSPKWTHAMAMGSLPGFFRPSPESCPAVPYIKPSPELLAMYRALIEQSAGGRKTVGITYSGGTRATGKKDRAVGLETWRPLIEANPHICWVSLEYRDDAGAEIEASGLPVAHHRFAVGKGADYDHTTAYIAALDHAVGISTTALHAAGSVGLDPIILVPRKPMWLYGRGIGDRFPWYGARVFRQVGTWEETFRRLAADDQLVGWLRSEGGGGVPRLQSVGNRAVLAAFGDKAAASAAAA